MVAATMRHLEWGVFAIAGNLCQSSGGGFGFSGQYPAFEDEGVLAGGDPDRSGLDLEIPLQHLDATDQHATILLIPRIETSLKSLGLGSQ